MNDRCKVCPRELLVLFNDAMDFPQNVCIRLEPFLIWLFDTKNVSDLFDIFTGISNGSRVGAAINRTTGIVKLGHLSDLRRHSFLRALSTFSGVAFVVDQVVGSWLPLLGAHVPVIAVWVLVLLLGLGFGLFNCRCVLISSSTLVIWRPWLQHLGLPTVSARWNFFILAAATTGLDILFLRARSGPRDSDGRV